jgi:small subunit ribosomal protein S10
MTSQQNIKLTFRAFDHRVLDTAVRDVVSTVKRTGAVIRGPFPLPTKKERFTVNRSTHIFKESREQFEIRNHTRVMYMETTPQTIDALMKLDLAAGVDVEIKLKGEEK